MSRAYYDAGLAAFWTAKLTDDNGAAVAWASLQTVTMTLRNAATGAIVNTRSAQNILPGSGGGTINNVTIDATTGQLDWAIQAADVTPADATADVTVHACEIKFTATVSGRAVSGSILHELVIQPVGNLMLATVDDVEYHLGRIQDADIPKVLREIMSVTKRCERYTGRLFKRRTGETQYFSRGPGDLRALYLIRFPVESITTLRESASSSFDIAGDYADVTAAEYHLHPGGTSGREPALIRFRAPREVEGQAVLRCVYTGGCWRETAGVDDDLRTAVAEQVAYRFQRRADLGVVGVSAGQGGSASFGQQGDTSPFIKYERDVLPSVRAVWDEYRAFHPTF